MDWATSKQYIAYDASKNGWAAVPPGTRTSTYQNPSYLAAAKDFAPLTLQEIDSVNVDQPGVDPQPVPGVQYVGIPEFEEFGQQVSAQITAAIDGQESVATALSKSQQIAQQAVIQAGLQEVTPGSMPRRRPQPAAAGHEPERRQGRGAVRRGHASWLT